MRTIDFIKVTSFCRLRKIFTMKSPIIDTLTEETYSRFPSSEAPPKCVDFPMGVLFLNQLFTVESLGI